MREITDLDFVAYGEFRQGKSLIPVVIRGSYSEFEHKPVRCIVAPDKSERKDQSPQNKDNAGQLIGIAQDGEEIWISELTFVTSRSNESGIHWEGTAENFIKGNM